MSLPDSMNARADDRPLYVGGQQPSEAGPRRTPPDNVFKTEASFPSDRATPLLDRHDKGTAWTGPAILSRIRVMLQGEGASLDAAYDLVPMVAPVRVWRDLERLATAGMAASAEQRGEFEDSRPGIAFDRPDIAARDFRLQDIDGFHHVIKGWLLDPGTPAGPVEALGARIVLKATDSLADAIAQYAATSAQQPEDSRPDSMDFTGSPAQWTEVAQIIEAHRDRLAARAYAEANRDPGGWPLLSDIADDVELRKHLETTRVTGRQEGYLKANKALAGLYARYDLIPDGAGPEELRKRIEADALARWAQDGDRLPGVGYALRIDRVTWDALPEETRQKVAGLAQVINLLCDADKAAEEELELAAAACGHASTLGEISQHVRFRLMAAAALIREQKTRKA